LKEAYSTEARERQKERLKQRKEAGEVDIVKKKFEIENHFDDCGTDLTGLGPGIVMHALDITAEVPGDNENVAPWARTLAVWWFLEKDGPPHANAAYNAMNLYEVEQILRHQGEEGPSRVHALELKDLANGCMRVSTCTSSRSGASRLITVVLNMQGGEGEALTRIVQDHKPQVALLLPGERGNGAWCGKVAALQHQGGRGYLVKTTVPTWTYSQDPWLSLMNTTLQKSIVLPGNIGFVSNQTVLLDPIVRHAEDSKDRPSEQAWLLANAIVDGVVACVYPSAAVGPDEGEEPPAAPNSCP